MFKVGAAVVGMAMEDLYAINSFEESAKVSPTESKIDINGELLEAELPARLLMVYKIGLEN